MVAIRRACALLALTALCAPFAVSGCEAETEEEELSERDAFALAIAAALCDGARTCCATGGLEPPAEGCETRMRNEVFIVMLDADAAKIPVLLEDQADDCVAIYEGAVAESPSCTELPHPAHLFAFCPNLFGELPNGDRGPGEPCTAEHECTLPEVGERSCHQTAVGVTALCTWLIPVEDGDACGPLGDGEYGVCPSEGGCVPGVGEEPARCGAAVEQFDACVDNESCVDDLVCVHGEGWSECDFGLDEGQDCVLSPDGCLDELFCDHASGVCSSIPILDDCEAFVCPHPLEPYCD